MSTRARDESDEQLMSDAVDRLIVRTGFPVAFGGLERNGAVHVSSLAGARTRSLKGLVVHATRGLGGLVLVENRARLALDYRSSRSITHDYDTAVLGEGIATLFAMPVLVQGKTRGVLYCGSWSQRAPSPSSSGAALSIARELASELHVRQEVRRRLAAVRPTQHQVSPAVQEEIRGSYAELRSIAAGVDDPVLRNRIANLERRLISLTRDRCESVDSFVHLSPRETDVLACAALGATNGQIGAALGLTETTVKSYIHAASAKLSASTRHSAVAKARRAGLLP